MCLVVIFGICLYKLMKLSTVPSVLIPKYFCAAYDYAGKADLSKGCWNPKRKLEVTTHFLEVIKQQLF